MMQEKTYNNYINQLIDKSNFTRRAVGEYTKYLLVETSIGLLAVSPDDAVIGDQLRQVGKYEENTSNILKKVVDANTNLLVLGAHVGVHVISMSRCVNRITAIEANPNTFEILKLNILVNKVDNCDIYNFAAAEKQGEIPFIINKVNSGGSKRKPLHCDDRYYYDNPLETVVKAVCLDDLLSGIHYDVVLIDIEGSEYYALKGMQKILDYSKILIMEFIPHHIRNVSGVSITILLNEIRGFYFLIIPSLNIMVEQDDFYAILNYMFENNIEDSGIIFSRNDLSNLFI